MHRNETHFPAFAFDAEMHHSTAFLQIPNLEAAKLRTAQPMKEQSGKNRPVAHAL